MNYPNFTHKIDFFSNITKVEIKNNMVVAIDDEEFAPICMGVLGDDECCEMVGNYKLFPGRVVCMKCGTFWPCIELM